MYFQEASCPGEAYVVLQSPAALTRPSFLHHNLVFMYFLVAGARIYSSLRLYLENQKQTLNKG